MSEHKTISQEINEEFKELSEVDYRDNISIRYVWQHLNGQSKERNFGFEQKSKPYLCNPENLDRFEKIKTFCETLIKYGNLEYALKMSGRSRYNVKYYINLLNNEAEKRGLPPIFILKTNYTYHNAKLNEKQVSYIKYLVTKHSTYKVAKAYNVSQSAIYMIKIGLTWKNVKAVINNKNEVKHINQYKKMIKYSNILAF